MATISDITTDARVKMRDFARFVQSSFPPAGRTYDMGRPNIDVDTVWVGTAGNNDAGVTEMPTTDFVVDARNGLIRINNMPQGINKVMIECYHFEWLLDSDLEYAAGVASNNLLYGQDVTLGEVSDLMKDVIVTATVVEALWMLLNEYARDIDVIASESVHITASQRYRAVSDLLKHWESELDEKMKNLNLGAGRLEVLNLRRVSRTTNRWVPVYKPREVGDYGPMERIWDVPGDGKVDIAEPKDELREDVYSEGEPPAGYMNGHMGNWYF